MKLAHLLALVGIPIMTVAATILAIWSRRVRDAFFFLIVALAPITDRLDVNFHSHAWYRGTSRGYEISLPFILSLALLIGCWVKAMYGGRRWFWPASLGLMLLYFFYAFLSVIMSEPRLFGSFELAKIFTSIVVFMAAAIYARTRREWTILLLALACTVGFEGLWAVKQRFLTHVDRVAGTLQHANSLSMYFCLATPPLVAAAYAGWTRTLRWFCGSAALFGAVGLLLTFSRAGIPVFALVVLGTVAACASWRMTTSRIVVRSAIVIATLGLVVASFDHLKRRYAEASLHEEYFDPTIDGRGIYLRIAMDIADEKFFGVGLNNWSYHVSRDYGRRLGFNFIDYDYLTKIYGTSDYEVYGDSYLAAPAHNLAALMLGELGYPGLLLFALLWLRWFLMGARFIFSARGPPLRTVGVGLFFSIAGIFGQSITEWVYRQSALLLTFSALLGTLAALCQARREEKRNGEPMASDGVQTQNPVESRMSPAEVS